MASSDEYRSYAHTLETLLAPGGILSTRSPYATADQALPGGVPSEQRAAIYDRVVDRYLTAHVAQHGQLPHPGRQLSLIVGPPGAGKSSALTAAGAQGMELSGTLMLERDELMRILLHELATQGTLPVPHELRDGLDGIPVVPAELHDLINAEGTYLAHRVAAVARMQDWNAGMSDGRTPSEI